jgi:ABC-type amino acid transport substrate-binding protein
MLSFGRGQTPASEIRRTILQWAGSRLPGKFAVAGLAMLSCLWGLAATAEPAGEGSAAQGEDAVLHVVVPPLEKSAQAHMYYFPELARLALQKTEDTDGPFSLDIYPQVLTAGRLFHKLRQDDEIKLLWGPAKHQDDELLRRIPVSLLRGLNSYRVLLIRAQDQERFAQINSLDELKALRGGMVSHWPDTKLLHSHDFNLVTPAHYELLFTLLEAGRIDYLSRGLYEVWEEHKANAGRGFIIEPTLMLYYPGDMYFYVNSENNELADRLERGLKIAMEDGSFDELFFSVPGFKRGFEEMTEHQRKPLYLQPPEPEHRY